MSDILFKSVTAFVAVYFFAILLDSPKRALFHAALTGGIGWFIYLVVLEVSSKTMATLVAGIVIALLSQYFARILKTPTTVYFLPGFIPIVPGEGIYRAVFAFIEEDYGTAQVYLNEALLIAGTIAVAIFVVDTFFNLQNRLKFLRRRKQEEGS